MGEVTGTYGGAPQSNILYREKARHLKALADRAADPASRDQFMLLARSYKVLAERATPLPPAELAGNLVAEPA